MGGPGGRSTRQDGTAFPFRDGRCCERVFGHIVAMTEPEPQATALAEPRAADVIEPYALLGPLPASLSARSQVDATGK